MGLSKPKVPNAAQGEELNQAKGAEGASALPPGNPSNPSEESPAHLSPLGIIRGFFSYSQGKRAQKKRIWGVWAKNSR